MKGFRRLLADRGVALPLLVLLLQALLAQLAFAGTTCIGATAGASLDRIVICHEGGISNRLVIDDKGSGRDGGPLCPDCPCATSCSAHPNLAAADPLGADLGTVADARLAVIDAPRRDPDSDGDGPLACTLPETRGPPSISA